ncbi:MAG: DUF4838 domain-containing protein [Lentisphaeria bacterium]|nr:DUF4838 domain-containing protein [Lentisphaeria bacterium]
MAFPLFSAELVIADKHSSNYQIVIPDDVGDAPLQRYVTVAGTFIQSAIQNASGAEIPLVRESQKAADKPVIYIGDTKALAAAGLSTKDFALWEHAIAVKGNDIFLYGTDKKSTDKTQRDYYPYVTLGSLKPACVFAEKFLNTRVTGMERGNNGQDHISEGVRTLPMERITVPDDFSFRFKPHFLNCCFTDHAGLLYMVANNHLFSNGAHFEVHYHVKAIPQDKYYPTHPEYFALIKGKRYYHKATVMDNGGVARPQYCLSNPEVQELIYQEALSRADNGHDVVELGQTDGFMGCECENCKKMYDTDDWGEKLWCLHRDMAIRLKKERPNVKIAIACYEKTHNTPKSFDKFPMDVIIDIAPADSELIKEWEKFNVTEMATWTYTLGGEYKPCGFSPAASFAELHEINSFYGSTPIKYFYNCGLFTAKAISGPWIYAWGRWYADPDEDADKILHDYCLYSFGEKAAPYFEKFFKLIDVQMDKHRISSRQNLGDFSKRKTSVSLAVWQARYPEDVVAKLVEYFDEGSKLCDEGNFVLASLKREFEYLKLTANVCNAQKRWNEMPTDEARFAIADALEARTNFIKSLPTINDGKYITGPGFEYVQPSMLLMGGYMLGIFGDVFDMDPEQLRRTVVSTQAVQVEDFDDPAWNDAQECELTPLKSVYPKFEGKFKVGYTKDAFLFKLSNQLVTPVDATPLERDGNLWKQNDVAEIFLAQGDGIARFAFSPMEGASYDALVNPRGRTDAKWNCEWTHSDRVEDGIWHSEVTIPFKSIGFTYVPGKKLFLQLGFCQKSGNIAYGWNISQSGQFVDPSGFGKLQLGAPKVQNYWRKVAEWEVADPTNSSEFSTD